MSLSNLARDPLRLSLFAVNPVTRRPISRLPVYAEINWTEIPPTPTLAPPSDRYNGVIARALAVVDAACANGIDCKARTQTALARLLDALLTQTGRQKLADLGEDRVIEFLAQVLRSARDKAGVSRIADVPPTLLDALLEAAVRALSLLAEIALVPPAQEPEPHRTTYPLGVLATDHVGYLSFDLGSLPGPVRDALRAVVNREPDTLGSVRPNIEVFVYPFGVTELRKEALVERRYTLDAIVIRLEMDIAQIPAAIANLGLLAMQSPELADWRLSPGSFATNPAFLVGADDCEAIIPANVASHDYNFYQVFGFTPNEVELPLDAVAKQRVRPGFVNEYRVQLLPIGHSLGKILYSFPLAPGESVNFAVIDWTRQDVGTRDEKTKVDEQLVHDLRRERVIDESVKASIEEWQRGGSLMGGVAASGGSAAGAGAGQGGGSAGGAALSALSGVAGGISSALGGAYTTSRGSRDIAGDTIQKLSDNISQAATSSRELYSTVVVQTSEAEKEAVETRTVVNYNHSHALTILYYEVLRHYRLVVSFVRRRPVLLNNFGPDLVVKRGLSFGKLRLEVDRNLLVHNRPAIEGALLDARLAPLFDTLEAVLHRERVSALKSPPPPAPDPNTPAGPLFKFLEFEIRSGGMVAGINEDDEAIWVRCNINIQAQPWMLKVDNGGAMNPPGSFKTENAWNAFTAGVPNGVLAWGLIDSFDISFQPTGGVDDMSVRHVKITGVDTTGNRTPLLDHPYLDGDLTMDATTTMTYAANRPPPPPPPPGRPDSEIEEDANLQGLLEHIIYHRGHYERALRMGTPAADRARLLSEYTVSNGKTALELIENRPLEVLGDFVAYPCADPAISDAIENAYAHLNLQDPQTAERLVSYPTRGVFAEAKLGHCNASEEIDNTRFWDWQTSPIPHLAPDIAPTQTVTPQVVKVEGLGASAMPSALISIVQPPAAPDPHGMTAAMTALATANIFRDMSGQSEVTDLLKKLTDASVQIAGVAKDIAIGAKPSSGSGQSSAPTGASGSKPSGQENTVAPSATSSRTPEQRDSDRLGNLDKQLDMANRLPPPAARAVRAAVKDAVLDSRYWTVQITPQWGGIISGSLDARFNGTLSFTTGGNDGGKYLDFISTNLIASWNLKEPHDGMPSVLSIQVDEIKQLATSLSIKVPGPLDGVDLAPSVYNIPLRTEAINLATTYKQTLMLNIPKITAPLVRATVTLMVAKKDIEVSFQLGAGGTLGGDLTGALAGALGNLVVGELTGTVALKAAAAATVNGQAGIKGTLEVSYIVGLQMTQADI